MRRVLPVLGALAVAALVWGIVLWNTAHFGLGYWLQVHTGTVNEPGPYYGFFSGFGSDITEITLLGGIVVVGRRFNCHTARCWRIGRHHLAGGQFLVCKKHFQEVTGIPPKLTVDVLTAAHADHLDALGCHHDPPGA